MCAKLENANVLIVRAKQALKVENVHANAQILEYAFAKAEDVNVRNAAARNVNVPKVKNAFATKENVHVPIVLAANVLMVVNAAVLKATVNAKIVHARKPIANLEQLPAELLAAAENNFLEFYYCLYSQKEIIHFVYICNYIFAILMINK